jgi:putative glutamine amidotransferase
MPKPLIGLTTEHFSSGYRAEPDRDAEGVLRTYIEALLGAGGLPVLIPLSVQSEDLRALYERLDGVLLPGGGDIDPAYFTETPSPHLGAVDLDRDRSEVAVAQFALNEGKPLLGVCRGMQVMNVAQGGSLYQDLPSEYPTRLERHAHPVSEFPREHLAHLVQVEEDSHLARVLGNPILNVNSRHHQSVKHVGRDLVVVAKAPDGVIEGVEKPGHPFALGVQWHPENLQTMPEMKRLFEKFIEAASKREA